MEGTSLKTPRRAKTEDAQEVYYPKTPYNIRARVKKKLIDFNSSVEELVDDSDKDSDYTISESESSSDQSTFDSTEESEEDNSDSEIKANNSVSSKSTEAAKHDDFKKMEKINLTKKRKIRMYIVNTDDYFSAQSSKKSVTSNNTLDKLKTAKLDQGQLQKLLLKANACKHHAKCFSELEQYNKTNFIKWLSLLHEGFNLLLYGLGSKKNILTIFQEQYLTEQPVVVVNGFFPSLTLKNVLDSILVDVLESSQNPGNHQEACDIITELMHQNEGMHLYVIFNNIDGNNLRSGKCQNVLARLGSINNLHIIATIDHINAPIIWDQSRTSKFNFVWWDVTTFEYYLIETCFEDSMLVQRSGTLALSSLNNVFMSLTKNAKSIYLIIVKYQLENKKSQHYEGLLFKDLYWACREAFLVSSDLALRAQLTEFVDHKMVKFKRSISGGEHLIIPLQNSLLQQFVDEQPV